MTRDAVSCLGLCVAIFLALILQEFIPPLAGMGMARVVLVPMIVCYAALTLPFAFVLPAVFFGGICMDLMNLQWVDSIPKEGGASILVPEMALGVTVFYFLAVAMICQGLRVLFLRGYWWLFGLMGGLSTSLLLALQFIFISYRRFDTGGIEWNALVLWRILTPGLIAMLLAPLFHMLAYFAARNLLPAETRAPRIYG